MIRMPAEWEPHLATWLSWPHNEDTWPGDFIERVEKTYLHIIEALQDEEIHILTHNKQISERVEKILVSAKLINQVNLHPILTDDCWIRDYGPLFIKDENDQTTALSFQFNHWGNKYTNEGLDNRVAPQIAELLKKSCTSIDMVLEGGSIESNGNGTLMTTSSCLLNKNRNPDLNQQDVEQNLKKYLGVQEIMWVNGEIEGDDTDGHIDNLARFVGPNRTLTDLPLPQPLFYKDRQLPASYANFYIANKVVLVPTFQDKNDERATSIIKGVFPERTLVGIDCRDLIVGQGGIHCITLHQPEG